MSEKISWLLLEGDTLKVVYGNSLKCVKVKDAATLDYNIDFFSKLFGNGKVVSVEKATILSYEEFQDFLMKTVCPEASAQPAPMPSLPPPEPLNIGGIRSQMAFASSPQVPQQPQRQSQIAARPDTQVRTIPATSKRDFTWIKSNAETTIILDDLLTNRLIQGIPGAYESLSIPPDRCVNLLSLNPQSVKSSQTLRRYLQAGVLELTTAEEAMRMATEADAKKEHEDQQGIDQYSPMIPAGMSAADFADSIANGRVPNGDDPEIIEVVDDAPMSRQQMMPQAQQVQIDQMANAFSQPAMPPSQAELQGQMSAAFMGAPVAGLHEDMSAMRDFGLEDLISIAEQPMSQEQRFVSPVPARPQRAKGPVTSFAGRGVSRKE